MNRQEVVLTIKKVGSQFRNVMTCFHGTEFAAGYYQAIRDMVRLFEYAPLAADFETERDELNRHISNLSEERNRLRQQLNERETTIEKLMEYVDIAEVLGVRGRKQDVRR